MADINSRRASVKEVPPVVPDDSDDEEMGYQQTLMCGRYSKALGEFAKQEAAASRKSQCQGQEGQEEAQMGHDRDYHHHHLLHLPMQLQMLSDGPCYTASSHVVAYVWNKTFAKLGEDWVFLAVLGILMAVVSFAMDLGISVCNNSRVWLFNHLGDHIAVKYFAWTVLPVTLVLFSTGFVHIMTPQAIGSGIPEMKTILRGVVLKEYLSARTLIAKVVGLTATLGSGMPLGKEGPFVHIASIVSSLLSKVVNKFQKSDGNQSRNNEMLAAACAVGVACCFGAPVGGVLFSIEVTAVIFAVRNYWRGFFAAVCGAMTFRLLAVWFHQEGTIVAVFSTRFGLDFPYERKELVVFAVVGVFCGFGGALYVYLHRTYVTWMRSNGCLRKFLQKNRFIYPFFVSWTVSTLAFPPWSGQLIAGGLSTHEQIENLFSNYSWTQDPEEVSAGEWAKIRHWVIPGTSASSVFATLTCYILFNFFASIVCSTLPVPFGVLIPTFKVGAAFGRLVGEAMHMWFPSGLKYGDHVSNIVPGGYATVGAAAFSGAVTHTISISVIVFEMTGQITHCIPILVAVLVSNAIAHSLELSCYDSIIKIKNLPYLPDIPPSSSNIYNVFVRDFMVRDVKYVWRGMTFKELKAVLEDAKKVRAFPIVDAHGSKVLLGSIQRTELQAALDELTGRERRQQALAQKLRESLKREEDERRMRKERMVKQIQEKLEEKRKKEEEGKARKMQSEQQDKSAAVHIGNRRPSRFAVTTQSGTTFVPDSEEKDPSQSGGQGGLQAEGQGAGVTSKVLEQLKRKPPKSILKKNNCYTIHGGHHQPTHSLRHPRLGALFEAEADSPSPQTMTVTGGGSERMRNAFQSVFRISSQLSLGSKSEGINSISSMFSRSPQWSTKTDQSQFLDQWEEDELFAEVIFDERFHIDNAPFQLVEKSGLLKVHSLFSMMGLNHAYVTALGRLIGVVGLKELRKSIEDAKNGQLVAEQKRATTTEAALMAVNKDVVVTMSGDDSSCTSEDETAGLMN